MPSRTAPVRPSASGRPPDGARPDDPGLPSALRGAGLPHSVHPIDLAAVARDLWPRGTLDLRAGRALAAPAAVVWPRSAAEVRATLDLAADLDRPVVPWGAGSGVCGGAAGRTGAITVDLRRMRAIGPLDPDAGTVDVEPGALGQHLEDWLEARGWRTAHSPSSIMCSTVGGWAAARSAGQFSSRYGVFADMCVAARMETPAGRLDGGAWAPADAPDPLPLMLGSEGTLGVFTALRLRVHRCPATRWLRGYAMPDLESAWRAMRELLQARLWPSVLRLYDPVDTRISGSKSRGGPPPPRPVLDALREAVERVPALRRHLLELPLAMPRLVNRIADRIGDEALLIVGFEGTDAEVEAAVRAATPLLAAGRDLGAGPGERWFAHRHQVSFKLAPVFAAGAWADTMEVATSWSRLPALHDAVREAIGDHAAVMAHFSHAYPAGCSIYFSFAGAGDLDAYAACWAAALAAAQAAGATVTHHHGVGELKARAAAAEAGPALRLWREVRHAHDPQGRMNPGRLHDRPEPDPLDIPPPTGGPVYGIDPISRTARLCPRAAPEALSAALGAEGWALEHAPDGPLGAWLAGLRAGDLPPWATPLLGVQARFPDGAAVQLPPAPRSAAGPDLRFALIRGARPEWVEVPVRPLAEPAVAVELPPERAADRALAGALRPADQQGTRWVFRGPAAHDLAQLAAGRTGGPRG